MIALINGSFSNIEEASLHVSDLSIQRGYAAFDFLRTLHSKPLFIDDHLDRFFRSVDLLRLKPGYSKQQVKEFIFQLIEENKMEVSGIRMMMTGGFSPRIRNCHTKSCHHTTCINSSANRRFETRD